MAKGVDPLCIALLCGIKEFPSKEERDKAVKNRPLRHYHEMPESYNVTYFADVKEWTLD